MSNRTCFLYYKDWAEALLTMPETLRLKIDDAIKRYVLYGEEPTDAEVIYSMFAIIRQRIERDEQHYNETCEKNRDNIRNRWEREKNTTEYERIRPNTNATDRIGRDRINIKESTNVPKKNVSLTKSIEERRKDFENTIRPYLDRYGQKMCNEFCSYWTEPNKSNTKMRFELQKTWEIGRRLSRWNGERRAI